MRVSERRTFEGPFISIAIIGVLMVVAARNYLPLAHRTRMVEVMNFTTQVKYDAVLYHAETGEWPSPEQLRSSVQTWTGRYITVPRLEMSRGSFNVVIRVTDAFDMPDAGDWNLSFLGENLASSSGEPYTWRCGYSRRSGVGGGDDLPNLTNVPIDYLPSVCRY